ncbi:hypothetical protein Q1695_015728 [Nippostrongylus brasiliensis]|nr:hypothetical protein Q1695_015728 [Nippostrongylus brasiliensis]
MPSTVEKAVPHVCQGIDEDLRELFKAFREKRSLRLVKFHEVATEYGLDRVYAGRLSLVEYIEFAEHFLSSAFAYTRLGNGSTSCSIQGRVFGIYMTYVLYYAQATDYVVKIRCTSVDLRSLLEFVEKVLIPSRHLDAVGCIDKLVHDDAFSVVAFCNDFDPVAKKKGYNKVTLMDDDEFDDDPTYEPLLLARTAMNNPILKAMTRVEKEMADVEEQMGTLKRAVANDENSLTPRLRGIFTQLEEKFAADTDDIDMEGSHVKKAEVTVKTEESYDPTTSSNHSPLSKGRSSIRERAYNSAFGPGREKSRRRKWKVVKIEDDYSEAATRNLPQGNLLESTVKQENEKDDRWFPQQEPSSTAITENALHKQVDNRNVSNDVLAAISELDYCG